MTDDRDPTSTSEPAPSPFVTRQTGVSFKLERFEGPLDLLLHLIKRDEIDIYDIPIAHITNQYLSYLDLMRQLDLDVAGEFIVMAATLMRIKAKMLLPLPPVSEDEQGDPREELVQRLVEYRQFKEAATTLKTREDERRLIHERGMLPGEDETGPLPLAKITLFDLLGALNRVLARVPEPTIYAVQAETYAVEDKMIALVQMLRERGQVGFEMLLLQCRTRGEMVVTFIALLELIKLGEALVLQTDNFGDITILAGTPETNHVPPQNLLAALEALLFSSDQPLSLNLLVESLDADPDSVSAALEELGRGYADRGAGVELREIAGGWLLVTTPDQAEWVGRMLRGKRKMRLSRPALETMAIIAYKQPVTKSEIEAIRGVDSTAVLATLLERNLITIRGRSKVVGRPLLYGTTPEFLDYFGLKDLSELPRPEELRSLVAAREPEQLDMMESEIVTHMATDLGPPESVAHDLELSETMELDADASDDEYDDDDDDDDDDDAGDDDADGDEAWELPARETATEERGGA